MADENICTRQRNVESTSETQATIRKEMRFEDAIRDARNLSEFLYDVSLGNLLLHEAGNGAGDLVLSTEAAWGGLALVHRLLTEKITVLEECYFYNENHTEA